jgi:hypothetical protein
MVNKAKLAGIALGALIVLGGASAARADNWGRSCEKKIEHEQRDLNKAIAHHGSWSREAQEERRELDRLYDRCYQRYRGDRDRDNWRHEDRDDRHYDRDRNRDYYPDNRYPD